MSHTDAPGATPPADAPVAASADATVDTAARRRPRVPAQRARNGARPAAAAEAPVLAEVVQVEEKPLPPRGPDDTGTDLMLYVPPAYLNIGPPIPAKSGRGGLIGVIALIIVLALISVVATVAYFMKSNAYDKQAAQLRDERATVAQQQTDAQDQQTASNAKDAQIANLTAQITAANDQLATLRANAAGDSTKLTNLAEAQVALAACISADKSWITLLRIKASATSLSKAQKKANTACGAANKYMP